MWDIGEARKASHKCGRTVLRQNIFYLPAAAEIGTDPTSSPLH